jgi:hypothetical protein
VRPDVFLAEAADRGHVTAPGVPHDRFDGHHRPVLSPERVRSHNGHVTAVGVSIEGGADVEHSRRQ